MSKQILSKSFIENHDKISEDVAGELIVKSALKIREIEELRAADERLAAAKNIVKDLNEGYNSSIKYEKAKIKFLLEKITEIQTGAVNPDSGAND
jgi:hypothetical protein